MLTLIQCYVVFFTFTCNKFYCLSHEGDKWNEILTIRKSSSGRAHWWRNGRDNKAKHGSSLIGIRLQRMERSKHIIIHFGWIYQMRSIACLWPQTMASIRIHTHLYKCDGTIKPELAHSSPYWQWKDQSERLSMQMWTFQPGKTMALLVDMNLNRK